MSGQTDLFGNGGEERAEAPDTSAFPPGFRYAADLITREGESDLLAHIRPLPFREFEFQGYTGKRRVVSFGWRYDFNERRLEQVSEIPAFLLPLRDAAARFAGLEPNDIQHALVTEYGPGAAIGWHRDKGVFDEVIGVSLLSACVFRLRRAIPETGRWERVNLLAAPRSVYLLSGASRSEWEHSIPAVESLRYSVTFRRLRAR